MTDAQAARQYVEADAAYKAAGALRDEAKAVLLARFAKPGAAPLYRGISYSVTHGKRLDANLARKLLGERAHEAEVPTTRETLTVLPVAA